MKKIGITEAGDAGLDLSWIKKLMPDVNIIITKHLTVKNKQLIEALLENSYRIILHVTCTGYGGTEIEPNVPTPFEVYDGVKSLIRKGFPVSNIVLRTDPIIPTMMGIERAKKVWMLFSDLGIKRCRYSVIDMYPHVKERFLEKFGTVPFDGFQAPDRLKELVRLTVENNKGLYQFESCAEKLPEPVGCISKRDFDILGAEFENEAGGFQRKGCLCCAGKTELLAQKHRCPSGCLYCYWRDDTAEKKKLTTVVDGKVVRACHYPDKDGDKILYNDCAGCTNKAKCDREILEALAAYEKEG